MDQLEQYVGRGTGEVVVTDVLISRMGVEGVTTGMLGDMTEGRVDEDCGS